MYNKEFFCGLCPKCGDALTKRYKKKLTRKDLKKHWFYSQFVKCASCSYVLLNDKYKIVNSLYEKLENK